ncbi:hypothetical protein [Mucilaginibacter paludis]|uniref:hypothetical protein n=1 Tax=Mucilaginibacter paludis TaxID=423351 RepID=UPI0012F9A6A1|nr:hypothetical protein [Mucilaginibacter paludis]
MKKVQLSLEGISGMLTKEQMKKITGGYGGSGTSCSAGCPSGQSASITNCDGTCTGYQGYCECVGTHNSLKKTCA